MEALFAELEASSATPPAGTRSRLRARLRRLARALAADASAVQRARPVTIEREVGAQRRARLESLALLAGGLAHDFNNVLIGVLANSSLALLDLPLDSPARRPLQEIENAARRAADLTRLVLTFSGRAHLAVEPVDLNALVQESVASLTSARGRKSAIRFQPADPLPSIEADASRLRLALTSLVANALEAMGPGRGVVTLSTDRIDVGEDSPLDHALPGFPAPGSYVVLDATDTGAGMTPEVMSRAFEPYFTTKPGHRGLGLSIVLGIVRSHKGAIVVETRPKGGTRVRVLLPIPSS